MKRQMQDSTQSSQAQKASREAAGRLAAAFRQQMEAHKKAQIGCVARSLTVLGTGACLCLEQGLAAIAVNCEYICVAAVYACGCFCELLQCVRFASSCLFALQRFKGGEAGWQRQQRPQEVCL